MFSRTRTLKDSFNQFQLSIQRIYDPSEARSIAQLVFKELLGYDTIQLILKENDLLPASMFEQLDHIIYQLNQHKPVQYILGYTEFYDLKTEVNEHVLIPRPETEELVDWVLKDHSLNSSSLSVIDVCTGSGCIPLALKSKRVQDVVSAIDISQQALLMAEKNSKNLKLDVHFFQLDILNENLPGKYDILICNPPYVRESEKERMNDNVLKYEPHLALFVEDINPLIFYTKIISQAESVLKANGSLYFEINEDLGQEMINLFDSSKWKNPELKKDLRGKDRMLKAQKL